jgi:hypothetical protein
MKELKSIFGLLLLLVGSFVMYKVWPAYWGNFKLERMIQDQSVSLTYGQSNSDDIAALICDKARDFNIPLTPDEVTVNRTPGALSIAVNYSVHIDVPIYPFDLNFKTSTTNHNVMAK